MRAYSADEQESPKLVWVADTPMGDMVMHFCLKPTYLGCHLHGMQIFREGKKKKKRKKTFIKIYASLLNGRHHNITSPASHRTPLRYSWTLTLMELPLQRNILHSLWVAQTDNAQKFPLFCFNKIFILLAYKVHSIHPPKRKKKKWKLVKEHPLPPGQSHRVSC